jgi:hypothetical protein
MIPALGSGVIVYAMAWVVSMGWDLFRDILSLEKFHLAHAKRRRGEIQSGKVASVDGVAALQKVRKTLAAR